MHAPIIVGYYTNDINTVGLNKVSQQIILIQMTPIQ